MDCCGLSYILYAIIGGLAIYFGQCFIPKFFNKSRWNNTKKDVVVVHCPPPGRVVPNPSPWVVKLLTYLRMANIPYELDHSDPFGPKGKTPWISYNGQHLGDSQFIVEFFKKKLDKSFNYNYSEEKLAIATAVRIMCEEHLFWGFRLEVFVFNGMKYFEKMCKMPYLWLAKTAYGREIKKASWSQGIYRHSRAEIEELIIKDLRAVSKILGNKQFICGDDPCEDDCAIFGSLSGPVWGLPGSSYDTLLNGELKNIREYCFRMKSKFWPDWDKCLNP